MTSGLDYDPRLGRWLGVDPVVHAYQSPYSGLDNNPIIIIDPDGKNGELAIDKENGTITVITNFHFSTNTSEAFTSRGKPNNFVTDLGFMEFTQSNWKDGYSVDIDGKTYEVNFKTEIIVHDTHEEAREAWKSDPASNFLLVREDGRSSYYATDEGYLSLNAKQQIRGDGKTLDHEKSHVLGIGHNNYKNDKGTSSISSYAYGKRDVIQEDVFNVVSNAVQLANKSESSVVNITLQTGTDKNTLTVQDQDGKLTEESLTYPVIDRKNE